MSEELSHQDHSEIANEQDADVYRENQRLRDQLNDLQQRYEVNTLLLHRRTAIMNEAHAELALQADALKRREDENAELRTALGNVVRAAKSLLSDQLHLVKDKHGAILTGFPVDSQLHETYAAMWAEPEPLRCTYIKQAAALLASPASTPKQEEPSCKCNGGTFVCYGCGAKPEDNDDE